MKLIDTSAWIEYYRERGNEQCARLVSKAVTADLAAVNGIIQIELLVFAASSGEFSAIQGDLSALHWLELSPEVFSTASRVGFDLRRQGVTVPATDLLIAACAMTYDAVLIHCDRHYESVARHTALRTTFCGRSLTSR